MGASVLVLTVLAVAAAAPVAWAQFGFDDFEDESEDYKGKLVGTFNSYHHQVNGEVYAVNKHMLLIKNFVYDGNGKDTFFWAGGSNRPGIQGFIVPNEDGRTNVLRRYLNDEITITLPDRKTVYDIKWFSVYDLTQHEVYGDIYIPDEFEAPGPQILTDILGRTNGIRARRVVVMDSKTIKLEEFSYDGNGGDVVFWVGVGAQPSSKGHQVPDEMGYLSPLRRYDRQDLYLTLPGEVTVFGIRWLSVYNRKERKDLGHIILPSEEGLNVPPSLVDVIHHETSLPNCEMLHSNLLVAWSVFAPTITIQLAGLVGEREYIGFGVSGNENGPAMVGADAAVGYVDGYLGYVDDYNITAKATCSGVTGIKRGVCRDEVVGGIGGGNQLQSHARADGVTTLTFRRPLVQTGDAGDREIRADGPTSLVWAIGPLARNGRLLEPTFHHTYPKSPVRIEFGRKEARNNCVSFTRMSVKHERSMKAAKKAAAAATARGERPTWGPFRLFDPTLRSFDARLGPSGGAKKGYTGTTGQPSVGVAWYINGYMTPELYLRRGLTYAFRVEGGADPYHPEFYHPFIITNEPAGGFERLTDEQKRDVRIVSGVEFTRRGVPQTTAAGRLCLWRHRQGVDRRLDDNFATFERFRNSLRLECEKGEAAVLEVTPNATWPDTVYYNSYTHPYMGWKIHIVDSFNQRYSFVSGAGRTADEAASVPLFISLLLAALSSLACQ